MSNGLCKIRIQIKDYYPKLKIIPYNEYDCIISFNEDKLSIPLKDIENTIFENEPQKINSDLVYNIDLIVHENNNLISNSVMTIPYIRFIQVVKMKTIKYEQQIKLLLGDQMKEKIFGPGIWVGSIFIKFIIEINGTKDLNSIIEFNNNNMTIKNNSKRRFKSHSDFNLNAYLNNLSNKKNKNSRKNFEILQSDRNSKKYIIQRTKESKDFMITSISKDYPNKDKFITTQTSPFAIRNHFKQQSVQKYNNKNSKKYISNCFSPQSNLKKIFSNEMNDKKNINLKKYTHRLMNKVNMSKNEMANADILSKCFSDISIREKQIIKAPKTQKRNNRNIFSQDFNKNSLSITGEIKKKKSDKNFRRNKSIENNKSVTIKKIVKKTSYKINHKNNIKSKNIRKASSRSSYVFNNSIPKIDEKEYLKYKTSKNFFKNKKNADKSQIEENKNKSFKKLNIINENKIKDLNFIKNIKSQEDLKNNMISIIDNLKKKDKEANQSYINKINTFDSKYLLYKEKIVLENKQQYSLQNQNNTKDFKNFIHVKINSKYNNIILNKMSRIKKKELNILQIILNNKNNNPKKIIEQKLKQQKQLHTLLNLIRDLIKIYGNLSHLYDDDNNKKILIKSLFLRYNIKEREWSDNDNLVDIYDKMINEIKNKKNKEKIKDKFKREEFKAIKEEEENENDEEEEDEEQKEDTIKEEAILDKNNEENMEYNIEENMEEQENIEKKEGNNEIKKEENNEIKEEENKVKQEKQLIIKGEEKMKENITNENANNNIIEKNKKENKILEIKENLIKNSNNNIKNNIINLDEDLNTNNINNINNDLLNNKNIIINNFIINK